MSGLIRIVGLSVVVPLLVIQWQLRSGASPLQAIALAAIFPVLEMVFEAVQTKRVGLIAIISLIGILSGLGLGYITGNAAFALLKDSVFTGMFGIAFLVSLLSAKPLIYRFNLDLAGANAAKRTAAEALWQQPSARRHMRTLTLIWGIGLILEALARLVAVATLPIVTATALSPFIQLIAFGALAIVTVVFARRGASGVTRAA